ncbi:MAG: peptidoglycan-binding protein [Negativicutes bacterium]|nr:peptidoglycan-binding protein [Negativicutes bacterium]
MNFKKLIIASLTLCFLAVTAVSPIVSAASLGERTLRMGSIGEDVKELQAALKKAGMYNGKIDGIFGKNTEKAVAAWQQAKQLTVDGIAGEKTLAMLAGASAAKVSRGATPDRYANVYEVVATAYAPGPHDNGKWGNLTHIGTTVRPGIIAVDPKLIPLGSRVYIEFADGSGVYVTAEDTGGAIKGKRIDIAMSTVDEAYKFGMQKVKVYVLP